MRRIRIMLVVTGLAASLAAPTGTAAAQGDAARGNDAPVLVTADELQYDQELGLTVAKGHVELSQNDQILLADTVTYNQRTDTVTASGHVSLMQPSGDVAFADFMELHDNFRDGFIKDVRLLLSDRSRMAGNTARRVGGTRTEVRRGVYSPCELCAQDPTHPPVWQIKAENIATR
jgi:LPS-assembly protein